MIHKINSSIAKYGDWIFLGAALYRFTFYILDLITAFNGGAGRGVKYIFSGLFDAALYLILLAVFIGIARKLTGISGISILASNNNGYAPQASAAPQVPPVIPQVPAAGMWLCSTCGTQNADGTSFCSKCGKPK